MLLTSPDGTSFQLRVVGYQFPKEQTARYDSNWLNIAIDVSHQLGCWSRTDPAMLTYEVERLAKWFTALAAGDRTRTDESFVEPNLSFELTEPVEKLRISFRLEFSPPWSDRWDDENCPFVEFPLDDVNLKEAAASLLDDLSRFPQRHRDDRGLTSR